MAAPTRIHTTPVDEDAYRRGFQQGSEMALRAVEAGKPAT